MDTKNIVVVIPVYLPVLSVTEEVALKQCLQVLSNYSIIVIKPQSLDLTGIISRYNLPQVANFPDECFSSLRSYNKLVLSESFYHYFEDYAYMLIYQLDAYVFKDELLYWANKGYDYIGAPWVPWNDKYLHRMSRLSLFIQRCYWKFANQEKLNQEKYFWYQVGNGGLSLRKVDKMIQIARCYKEEIDFLLADNKVFLPEDVFLLLKVDKKGCKLKKPHWGVAMKFSMEHNPLWVYKKNNCQLPFGCHNWSHPSMSLFWSKFIK